MCSNQSVTADDVAAAAGVSRWTVTRAFKKGASISAKNRAKVLSAAEELGYAPDLSAASLASDRSNLVALLIDDFLNPHKLVVLERLSRILRHDNWGTLLINMLDDEDGPEALLTASQRRVDAIVVIGTRFDDKVLSSALGARRIKKLIIFARSSSHPNTITIACDDAVAMRSIGQHLLDRGYQHPLFLGGPDTQSAKLMRKQTFMEFWKQERGVEPSVIHVPRYHSTDAYRVFCEYHKTVPVDALPDVVVCENDILAMGVMDAIRSELKLSIPNDIAVTGFDDIELAASPSYNLTTYRQPISAMAETLLDVLRTDNDKVEPGVEPEQERYLLQGQFIVRAST